MNSASSPAPQRIAAITLDERTVIRRSRAIEDERAAAITDLLKDNQFTPVSGRPGPFHLHLAVEENRLVMDIRATQDGSSESIVLRLDGRADDLVGFDKYLAATDKLAAPSSVARAIASGAPAVERIDKLVQLIGREHGITHPAIDRTVSVIDAALARTKVSAA